MEKFWSKVDKSQLSPGGCWLWTSYKKQGYGYFRINNKDIGAHRVSYELIYGPFDKCLFVCHKCDNPPCVNPDHLWLGTNQDNMEDMYNKNRGYKSHGMNHSIKNQNRKISINNKSGYRGVSWFPKMNKWRSFIYFNKKQIYLGSYITKEEAAKAYDEAAKKYFGEFAKLNFLQNKGGSNE